MYLHSKSVGPEAPGTAMIQRLPRGGMGEYVVSNCPAPMSSQMTVYDGNAFGLGQSCGVGCACGGMGGCGCGCKNGMGFFDSGVDPSGWGALEWGALLAGAYMIASTVFTTKRVVRVGRRKLRRARQKVTA